MGIIPINFESLNLDSAQGINNQSVNATLPIESLPQGNLSAMGFNVVGNGLSQIVAANLNLVLNPTATEITSGNLLENALGENISIVSINIQSQSYPIGSVINLQGIGNLTINANGDYSLLVDNINFSGALPSINFVVANSNQSDEGVFSVFIDRLSTGGAFQANDDYVAIPQGTNTSGNLLNNDNGDNLFIESFSLSSLPGVTFLSGETAQIQVYQQNNYLNVASIKIMADGNYFLTALNSVFNGNLPLITYTLRNNLGASDTAKLNIAINTNINPPALLPSNSVDIPSITTIPLPIPVVVPPIPQPLPILQPLNLSCYENGDIYTHLLESELIPNIQVISFRINGIDYPTGETWIMIEDIAKVKIRANSAFFLTAYVSTLEVPQIQYTISNGVDTASNIINLSIANILSLNDDPFKNSLMFWGRSNNLIYPLPSPFTQPTQSPVIIYGTFSTEEDQNEQPGFTEYIKINNGEFVGINNFSFPNTSLTFEIFCNITSLAQEISLWAGPNERVAYINSDNSLSLITGENTIETIDNLINLNEKTHIAITWYFNNQKWDSIKIWINGIIRGSFSANIIRNTSNPPPYNPVMSYSNYLALLNLQNITIPEFPTYQHKIKIANKNMLIYHFKITKAERYTQNFNPLTESYLF